VASRPDTDSRLQCEHLLAGYRTYYEQRILGCSLERWGEVKSAADLETWLEERSEHRESELGFYVRYGRQIGLDKIGRGHERFLSFGSLPLPRETRVKSPRGGPLLVPSGYAQGTNVSEFSQAKIEEHIAHSWFEGYEGGLHPSQGITTPYATGNEGAKYSWAKAPRYDGQPAETGPLAELVIAGHPLITDLMNRDGASAFVRELARVIRPATLLGPLAIWMAELVGDDLGTCQNPETIPDGSGYGLIEASRGALGHWITIERGKIAHYQVITPTSWNGSPRDSSDVRGPWEEALVGTPVEDPDNPVALGHVVRSFDGCLVCAVHMIKGGRVENVVRLNHF